MIANQLNRRQLKAVNTIKGPVLIVAGPGSGKTKVLTHRIAFLIEKGVAPENILAVTFTNKAAGEMRERVMKLLGTGPSVGTCPCIGTFHSICARILRGQIEMLGYKQNFVIYDEDDQRRLVKRIMKDLQIDTEMFDPLRVLGTISRAKDELIDYKLYQKASYGPFQKTIGKIYENYQKNLKTSNAVDFDDLIAMTVELLRNYPKILSWYQERWRYILVDEYQDTSHSQYVLVNLLAKKYRNICVVGDDWQCLPEQTKISTPRGQISINKLKKGDEIIAASGKCDICKAPIINARKYQYSGPLVKIYTKRDKVLTLTPNHIIFLRLSLRPDIHYVYLMFRKDKGYRIGIAQGSRYLSSRYNRIIGLRVRSNQERADKMWVLKICFSKTEASYWEFYYSFYYGIPTTVFFTAGRKMVLSQSAIDRIFQNIDTKKRVKKLMEDLLLHQDFPHFSPQGISRQNQSKRIKIRITMFSNNRKTLRSPWGLSRVSINSSDLSLKKTIEKLGFSVRIGKAKDWRTEIARLDYGEIEKIAQKIKSMDKRLELLKTALLTQGKRFLFQPASHAHPTMIIPIKEKGEIIEDEIVKVEQTQYNGEIYDLDIKNVHNYIAEAFVVHNSIYSWRGADFRNILDFEKDYPKAKVILLEENYRSTQNILQASHHVIAKNIQRKEKKLWTKNSKGNPLIIYKAGDERGEAKFIARRIKNLTYEGNLRLNDFVVLYRTNAQSRALEEAFLKYGIPYKVIGGIKFYQRREIKDILAYLKLIQNPNDSVSHRRIENVPPRKRNKKNKDFNNLISGFRKLSSKYPVSRLIRFILQDLEYEDYLKRTDPRGEERWENVLELLTVARKYNRFPSPQGLERFLEEVSLLTETDNVETSKEVVNLMTLHSAKGLEFKVVFIAGCEEGLLPHSLSRSDEKLEEERRLIYVGITRAKERVFLTFTDQRNLYGSTMKSRPSKFLKDIPKKLVKFYRCSWEEIKD